MRKAFIQLHIAVLLAGLTGVLGRLISLNEGLLVWYRLLLTAPSLWLLALLRKQSVKIDRRDLWRIFGVGGIAALHCGASSATNAALRRVADCTVTRIWDR